MQNVFNTMAMFVPFPVSTTEPGTIWQVMSDDGLVQPKVTVPAVPGAAVSSRPKTAVPPGVVLTVEGEPGATVMVTGELVELLKAAVTVWAAVNVTEQVPVPEQPAPLQPAKVELSAGCAVKVITVPPAKLAEQVAPQLIPAGALVTTPVPVPVSTTDNVKLFAD